jgi:WD40 repeat protein
VLLSQNQMKSNRFVKCDDPTNILQGHDEIVWAIEIHGNRVFSASADRTVRVWDTDSKRCDHVLEDHSRPVLSLAIGNDLLFSGSYDNTIKVSAGAGCAAVFRYFVRLRQ